MTIEEYRKRINGKLIDLEAEKKSLDYEEKEAEALRQSVENYATVSRIVGNVATEIQQKVHSKISAVVTRCLRAVFLEEAYEFKLMFERKRGRTEAKILLEKDGNEVSPRSGVGGGVQDVISFALRLSCLLLERPLSRKLIVLDEPFKFVHSPEYRLRLRHLIESLASELDFQFILTTGIPEYQIGKVVDLSCL